MVLPLQQIQKLIEYFLKTLIGANMKIVIISDTHMLHDHVMLPCGDMLIHAGDMAGHGTEQEVMRFNNWISKLDFKHKIVIGGNHDWAFEKNEIDHKSLGFTYLQDESILIDGIKIYGSPWQPDFCHWAFNLPRGKKLKEKWDLIPNNTDILITHCPPRGICDKLEDHYVDGKRCDGAHEGCDDLLTAVRRVKPKYHIFGHIHSGYGKFKNEHTTFINAAICTEQYQPINEPFVINYKELNVSG